MKKVNNTTHISGVLYQHNLEVKVTGENSKNPGTEFIAGTIEIATDNARINIVPIHFIYVTAVTSTGKQNATYATLKNIISGVYKTVMSDGAENATKLRVDSAIGLNEFYSDRNGEVELVSVKRNEGRFVHVVSEIEDDEKLRNTFDCDMIITKVVRIEANEENSVQYYHYFSNAYLYGSFLVICSKILNDILHIDKWRLRCSSTPSW